MENKCNKCSGEMREYVGFTQSGGMFCAANDCDQTVSGTFYRVEDPTSEYDFYWPDGRRTDTNDWAALSDSIEEFVKGYFPPGVFKFYEFTQKATPSHPTLRYIGLYDKDAVYQNCKWPIPTRNAQAQTNAAAVSKQPSSPIQHTHTSPLVVHFDRGDVRQPFYQVRAPDEPYQRIPRRLEIDLPRRLNTPRREWSRNYLGEWSVHPWKLR